MRHTPWYKYGLGTHQVAGLDRGGDMKATELIDSVELLLDRGLYLEATRLSRRVKQESPTLLSGTGWIGLNRLIPETPDRLRGYKFDKRTCRRCGTEIAKNWMVRHVKSSCAYG